MQFKGELQTKNKKMVDTLLPKVSSPVFWV